MIVIIFINDEHGMQYLTGLCENYIQFRDHWQKYGLYLRIYYDRHLLNDIAFRNVHKKILN